MLYFTQVIIKLKLQIGAALFFLQLLITIYIYFFYFCTKETSYCPAYRLLSVCSVANITQHNQKDINFLISHFPVCVCGPRWVRTAPTRSSWSAGCLMWLRDPHWRNPPVAASALSGTRELWDTWRQQASRSISRMLTR